jgi:Luciferase
MPVIEAKEKVHFAMMNCEGIVAGPHRFGGNEYKLGKGEIGHIHGNYLVDIPFPLKIRNEIVRKGEAEPHHILPESGWVSIFLNNEEDIERAIKLLKKSYELASEQLKKRNLTHQL